MNFNEYVRKTRITNKISLREFCRNTDFDPSNWSKIERGILLPPKDPKTLDKIAKFLGFEVNTNDYKTLFDLAAIASIPKEIVADGVLEKLPVFFRTLRGDTPTEEELRDLINLVQQNK